MNIEQLRKKCDEYRDRINKANENLRFNGGDISAIKAISNMRDHLKRLETEIANYVEEPVVSSSPEKLQPFDAKLENISDLKVSQPSDPPPQVPVTPEIPAAPVANTLDPIINSVIENQPPVIPTEQTLSLETPPTGDVA